MIMANIYASGLTEYSRIYGRGELQLWKYEMGMIIKEYEERPDFTIKPQENMMVRFRGETFHHVRIPLKDRSNCGDCLILGSTNLKRMFMTDSDQM